MQEIHSIGGGGGGVGGSRFFGGADRRLRPQNHQNNQVLKCPRCDSINTKFCYYNNYNLSQPRHFCKNCRRYWTKGGVLRNVPVGGGCRKSKRSGKPRNSSSTSSETAALPAADAEHNNSNNSNSSSESSSLTAAAATEAVSAVSAPALNSDSNMHESKLLNIHVNQSNPVLETSALEQAGTGDCGGGGIFSEIGNFTSLIASSSTTNEAIAPFGFGTGIPPEVSSFQWQHHHHHQGEPELKMQGNLGSAATGNGAGGFGSLDWHGGGADHQGLFDLPNTVDQTYWNQTHWSDHDNSTLFHLP